MQPMHSSIGITIIWIRDGNPHMRVDAQVPSNQLVSQLVSQLVNQVVSRQLVIHHTSVRWLNCDMGRSPYGNSMSCSKDVSSSGNPHHHSHSHHHHQQQHHHSMLKKGAWTPEEDQKLIDYINEHGHGNWRALPKKCGRNPLVIALRLYFENLLLLLAIRLTN